MSNFIICPNYPIHGVKHKQTSKRQIYIYCSICQKAVVNRVFHIHKNYGIKYQPFTTISRCEVLTINTSSCQILTSGGIPVTLTRLTIWETIETGITLFAGTLVHVGNTQTLASNNITEIVSGADSMAVTSCNEEM